MSISTHGIHHITAIASDPQKTVDFYTKILGLRLVKKSVNQDDVETYHLFFGDKTGSPGMDLTFFTFKPTHQGERGVGQVTTISLAVSQESFAFWLKRFDRFNIKHDTVQENFGIQTIFFYDPDDQRLELVGIPQEDLETNTESVWTTTEISSKEAIRSFDSATLTVSSKLLIEPVLIVLGYELVQTTGNQYLYKLPNIKRASYLLVEESPDLEEGINTAGTVHHIAFQVKDRAEQLAMRDKIMQIGLFPTSVIDRFYFQSVYFRTPAGILFELATEGPGFTADEQEETLGEKLALPPFLESRRSEIEANLTPIHIN